MMQLLQTFIGISDPQQIIELDEKNFQNLDCLHFYWKDKFGRYLGGNDQLAKDAGFNKIREMLKLTDLDLCFLPKKEAYNLRINDESIMKIEKPKIVIEPVTLFGGKKKVAISHKAPLRSRSNKIIGIVGFSFIIEREIISCNEKSCFGDLSLNFNNKYQLHTNLVEKTRITKRQMDYLYYLSRGMTAKQIGEKLSRSPRTVESHLEVMKIKLGCSSRYELIDKVLRLESFNYELK